MNQTIAEPDDQRSLLCWAGWHHWRFKAWEKNPNAQIVKCKDCGKEQRRTDIRTWVTK